MNVAICTNWVVLVHYNVISYCKWISFVGGDSNSKMREKGREGGVQRKGKGMGGRRDGNLDGGKEEEIRDWKKDWMEVGGA